MEIAENSDAALASLFLSFALADDELHPKEMEIISHACSELNIPQTLVSDVLRSCRSLDCDFISSCERAMSRITDEILQNKAIITLCDIAAADEIFNEKEKIFLSLVHENWNVEVDSNVDAFPWDERQKEVIEAPATARLQVHAGPGMGKTHVACARVSKLISINVEPTNIWLLSFTRTAVQEIRDRIQLFAENSQSALGVKVGTIDSRAWRIRCGFRESDIEHLFGGYDAGIQDVINLINNNPREISEFLETLEHVIIDEAQDITGVRARLIGTILKLLPETCGITIFLDAAQAIYDFTTDGENVPEEDRVNLFDLLKQDVGEGFIDRELVKIHRTDVPNLVELIEDLRLDIYVNDNIDFEVFNRRREIILEKASERIGGFDARELENLQNALVLFRRRSEVLLASSLANSEGIAHRIRMSGFPQVVLPWLGQLLSDYTEQTIDKEEFLRRWDKQGYFFLISDADPDYAWNLLVTLGLNNGSVSISEIRKRLARTPPDINAVVPDFGMSGPIIGTIHASKGREADEVVLRIPQPRQLDVTSTILDEESRVLFVGASRAKSKLYVGDGFMRAQFAPSLKSQRCFLETKKSELPAAQVEIGRENDIDPLSFVSKTHHSQETAFLIQRRLATLATKVPIELEAHVDPANGFGYQIWTFFDGEETGRQIGYFNDYLNKDLFNVLRRITNNSHLYRPPTNFRHFYLMGVTCFAASEDNPRLSEIHAPFSSTGIWLVPVVIGFPRIQFSYRSRSKRKRR